MSVYRRIPELDVGSVVVKSFSAWLRCLPWLLVIAVVLNAPVSIYAYSKLRQDDELRDLIMFLPVSMAVSSLELGLSIAIVIQALRRHHVDPGIAIKSGATRLLPLLGASLLTALAAVVIVPLVIWYVAAPAIVVERAGTVAALRRSSDLVKGNGWRVFGLLIFTGILGWLTSWLAERIDAGSLTANWVLQTAVSVLVGTFATVIPVVVYHELRLAKEGVDLAELGRAFD